MSEPKKIEVKTDDGVAPAWIHLPDKPAKHGVVFYPDAGSVRPIVHEMAKRVTALGYAAITPHIFYRAGDYAPFDFKTVFTVPEERERLMKLVRALDLASAMRDAGHWMRALRAEAGVTGPVACMGYCIGGRLAFATAGAHPDDVAAAACVHGGGIATDAPDSPHLAAEKIKARLWFGIADNDPSCTPPQQGILFTALASAHVRFTADHFKGRMHGFAVGDFPVYDEDAASTHWRRVEELFAAGFAG